MIQPAETCQPGPECSRCPNPAGHRLLAEDGSDPICPACIIAVLAAADRCGDTVTIAVTAAVPAV